MGYGPKNNLPVFPSIKQITKYGNTITEVYEIANVLANNIVKHSSTDNYS